MPKPRIADQSLELSGLSFHDEGAKAGEVWLGSQLALQRRPAGVAVGLIRPDSPAQRAGLQLGDFIFQIDGANVDDSTDVFSEVERAGAGGTLRLGVRRQGQWRLIRVELTTRPEADAASNDASLDAHESTPLAPAGVPETASGEPPRAAGLDR